MPGTTFEQQMDAVLHLPSAELGQSSFANAKGKPTTKSKPKPKSKGSSKKSQSFSAIAELPEAAARARQARQELAKAVKEVTGVHMPSIAPAPSGEVTTKDLKKAAKGIK